MCVCVCLLFGGSGGFVELNTITVGGMRRRRRREMMMMMMMVVKDRKAFIVSFLILVLPTPGLSSSSSSSGGVGRWVVEVLSLTAAYDPVCQPVTHRAESAAAC